MSYNPVGGSISYTLLGGASTELSVKVDILKTLLTRSDTAAMHIAAIRQKLLNYALAVFGGIVAFGGSRPTSPAQTPQTTAASVATSPDQLVTAAALVALMLVFWYLDVRYHRINHGWRKTSAKLIAALVQLANTPKTDVHFQRYAPEGEQTAEPFYRSGQPMIVFVLVIGSILNLCRVLGWFGR